MSKSESQLLKLAAQIKDLGREEGRAEGYKAGYEAGIAAVSKAAAEQLGGQRQAESKSGTPRKRTIKRRAPFRAKPPERAEKGMAQDHVLHAIERREGQTGAEITRALEGTVNPRTVRTVLRRLKGVEIEKRGDGWFSKKAVRNAA